MSIDATGARSGRQRANATSGGSLVLGPNDSLKGTLRTESGVTIAGEVEGEIFSGGDVVVEESAKVSASIEGRNVDIRGQVVGNVASSRRLSLSGSGKLRGDASASRLVVQDGATLNGSISMSGGVEVDHNEDTTPAEFTAETQANGELVRAGEHEGGG